MEDADYTAIKFVRARNLDIEKATKMFIECLKWRIEAGVDTLRETALKSDPDGIDPETFARQVNRGFTYIQGFNALGGPVVYVFVKGVKAGEQSQAIMEGVLRFSRPMPFSPLSRLKDGNILSMPVC